MLSKSGHGQHCANPHRVRIRAKARVESILFLSLIIGFTASCGAVTPAASAYPGPGSSATPVSSVAISPSNATLVAGESFQFTASVNKSPSAEVTWSASAGNVSNNGLFTAPSVPADEHATVTATSIVAPSKNAVAMLSVMPQDSALAYSNSENRYCGVGNIPRFPGKTDGPAQLPTACYYTGIDGTPSSGKVWVGKDPNALYAQARCGDVILLTAGQSVAETPNFPHKNCDDQHYITIRTSTPDAQLPPEGTRISPCFFGVASLPGRPTFPNCPPGRSENLGFKVVPSLGGVPVFGDHLRFIGIEFAKPPGKIWYGLDLTGSDHIIFDRVWIHGNRLEDTSRGIRMADTQYVAVINSYLNEFHCNSGPISSCTDAHAIAGGSNLQTGAYHGTFKIYGNFLEGSGESILFGGAYSVDTSCDIDIEGNLFFLPLTWDPADPTFDGGFNGHPYIVKNHIELKNACRVLVRGNRMMNVWAGFSQTGAAIIVGPASQHGLCPLTCQVHDVTIAYNYISNAVQALQIENGGNGKGWFGLEGKNYSIHDLIADGLDFPTAYKLEDGPFKVGINTGPTAPVSDIVADVDINHITLVEQAATFDGFLSMMGPSPAAEAGIVWKNSILPAGKYAVFSSGGSGNCANAPEVSPKEKFDACWSSPYVFTHNLIIGGNAIHYDVWPADNITDVTNQAGSYVNFNGGALGDYHLVPGSPGKNAADDGTDIGANVDAVMREIVGIH
jgi:hypothetical protein